MLIFSTCKNEEGAESPCVGNTRAQYMVEEVKESLEELCPSFQPDMLGCCDGKSVEVMKSLLGLASTVISLLCECVIWTNLHYRFSLSRRQS